MSVSPSWVVSFRTIILVKCLGVELLTYTYAPILGLKVKQYKSAFYHWQSPIGFS